MPPLTETDPVDRHGLVLAIWLPAGFAAVALYHYGVAGNSGWAIVSAFGVVIAGFIGHIIANHVTRTAFTERELALGLTSSGVALVAFLVASLAWREFAETAFFPTSIGFIAIVLAFALHLILTRGVRQAFEAFDVTRSFRVRRSNDIGRPEGRQS